MELKYLPNKMTLSSLHNDVATVYGDKGQTGIALLALESIHIRGRQTIRKSVLKLIHPD